MRMVKKTVRKYYKYQVQDFIRPNLTKNSTVGYDECACYADSEANENRQAYLAFDEDTSYAFNNSWFSVNNTNPHYIVFYSPNAIKPSSIQVRNSSSDSYRYYTKTGNIYASNDNTNWTLITPYTNSVATNGAYWEIPINTTTYYKYWKLESLTSQRGNYTGISNINFLNATQKVPIESTASSYDFYKDVDVYSTPKISNTYYGVK